MCVVLNRLVFSSFSTSVQLGKQTPMLHEFKHETIVVLFLISYHTKETQTISKLNISIIYK